MKADKKEPIIAFISPKSWNRWLGKYHTMSTGIWLHLYKKNSGAQSITYDEALDEALCFGWIDGQKDSYDEKSWLQKFTPRRGRSVWSKRNRERVARLIKEKRMRPAGLKAIEAAKKDGRWDRAYDSPKDMVMPEDFLKEVKKNKKAHEFFLTLNKANTYAIAWRLQTAKKLETREKRLNLFLKMMRDGEKFH
jgi:uncharacterized protein YdeI (YjbR/CyaY-like superfamily)